ALSEAESASGAPQDPYDREIARLRAAQLRLSYQAYCSDAEWNIGLLSRQLDKAREARAMTEVVAPFSGVIDEIIFKREGDAVWDGETMISMHATDVQLVAIDNAAQGFRYNMAVRVEYGPAKQRKTLTGRVVACDDVVPSDKRGGSAYVALGDVPEGETLRNLSVVGQSYLVDGVLVVPRRAVTLENGKYFVNILADGALRKRYVLFGYNNATEAWVAQGLNEGDTVVID
ncbi:MAG: hypothetical protein GX558_06975, partial [Clostridiales bacterium]|nr:hypothetical protein [Clostridiales bacterium]